MRKKSPYLRTSSFSNMAVRGGLTRFARPFGAAHSLRSRSVQLAAPVVEPRSGILIPRRRATCEKKPVLAYELFLKYGGEGGGLTRFARPFGAAHSLRSRSVQLAAPVVEPRSGILIPPQACNMRKKSSYLRTSSLSNMAVRGGLTRFARPFGAARSLRARSVQLAAPVVEPRSGVLIPPQACNMRKKSPYLRTSSS